MLQKGEILNQEERAEKWFKHIERAECIPLETKKRLCNRCAGFMLVLYFLLIILETIIIYSIWGSAYYEWVADFIFDMEANAQGPRRYQNLALAGFLAVGPYLVVPVIGILFFKKKWLSVQAKKALQSLGNENYR